MRPLTEDQLKDVLVNATRDERERLEPPHDFPLLEWDHLDFLAWRDPTNRSRGYVVAEIQGEPTGIVLRATGGNGQGSPAMCNICHMMQPGNQVAMFTARRSGDAGDRGDSVGTYVCADLTCHDNVRIAGPLAPSEVRASVDRRIDGTRHRLESFVGRVAANA